MGIPWSGEQLILCNSRQLGARAAIAIDDTTLGPALGGVRFAAYESEDRAVDEAVRLAQAMTQKNAAAGLPYGGAKSVILKGDREIDRGELMRWFAAQVAHLGGAYIPGVDVGTTVSDLAEMGTVLAEVACHKDDPSPWTALGVLEGMRAALKFCGRDELVGARVVIQGAGHVGAELARLLRVEDAEVELADVDRVRAEEIAADVGARAIDPAEVLGRECDIFAPCAIARVLNPETVPQLRCRLVAGAANYTLSQREVADEIEARGIVYVPDFLLNAGGVIQIHALREGWDAEQLRAAIVAIGARVTQTFKDAAEHGTTPLAAAEAIAEHALHAVAAPSSGTR